MARQLTKKERERFLTELSNTGLLALSASTVGATSRVILRMRKDDSDFDEACAEAELTFKEKCEAELIRRAVDGVETQIFHKGVLVGSTVKHSDSLLLKLLQTRDDKYKDKVQQDVVVTGGVLVTQAIPASTDDWLAEQRKVEQLRRAEPDQLPPGVIDVDPGS